MSQLAKLPIGCASPLPPGPAGKQPAQRGSAQISTVSVKPRIST